MAGVVKDLPLNPATGAPETVPWATQGTTLAPNAGQISTGWQPYGVGPPPDYRLENYARLTQSDLNLRANQAGLFLEYVFGEITLAGVAAGLNTREITIAGVPMQYTDQVGDTLADVYDAFATLINTTPTVNAAVYAIHPAPLSPLEIYGTEAGIKPNMSVAVIAGAGTITISQAFTDPVTRQGNQAGYVSDVVIGSPQLDDDADPTHACRIILDKSKKAFYAGAATGGEWDDGARGDNTINLGVDNQTTATAAVAMGSDCIASGISSVALGVAAAASGSASVAVGDSAGASASDTIAIGSSASASALSAVAIGDSASATAASSLAILGSATASGAVAVRGSASSADSIAIGSYSVAQASAAICVGAASGAGLLESSGTGSLATGYGSLSNGIEASGRGSRAHGAPNNATNGPVYASGVAADAIGELIDASGDYSSARGQGAVSSNRGEHVESPFCDITLLKQDKGKHQSGRITLACKTTDATATRFCTDAINGTGSNWTPADYRAYAVNALVVAKDGAGKFASWVATGLIEKQAGTVTIFNTGGIFGPVGVSPTHHVGAGFNALNVAVTASGGSVVVTATGIAATDIRWTCAFFYAQTGEDP